MATSPRRKKGRSHKRVPKRIIFLDIDGVLNCSHTPNPRKLPYIVDKRLLARFRKLVARTGAGVVLSSSWRIDPVGCLAARYWGIPFIDVSPDMPRSPRSAEIRRWLRAHPAVKRFVIIDDEDDGLDELPLFQPSRAGLTMPLVRGIEAYLKGATDRTMRANRLKRLAQHAIGFFERNKD